MTGQGPSDLAHHAGLLDALCEALPAAIIVYDRNDQLVFASRQILNFFPIPPQYLKTGTRLRDFLGALYDSGMKSPLGQDGGRATMSRDEWIAERIASHWRERADHVERYGFERWIRFVKRRLPAGHGICIATDVSEHNKREEQWRADLERVQITEQVLDSVPFPVFVKDRNLAYIAVNKAFCAMRGLAPEALLGRTIFDVMAPDLARAIDDSDRMVLETGKEESVAERLITADGRALSVVKRKVRVGHPGRYLIVTALADISEIVSGNVPFPEKPGVVPVLSGSVPPIGLEDVAATFAGTTSERFTPDRLADKRVLVLTANDATAAAAGEVLARLGVDTARVHGTAEFSDFLAAARAAGVEVDLALIDMDMEFGALDIAERAGLDVLPFDGRRVASELSFQLVRHFNSRLQAQPANDGEFDFEIETGNSLADVSLVEVLVAEDNEINQIVFSQILEGLGYSYSIAATGPDAVRMAEELSPRIILMDTTLPGLNGFEAARQIRARESDGHATPIIGVLAQSVEHDRSQCFAAGMNSVISKPLSPDMIEDLFRQFLPDEPRMGAQIG